MIGPERAQEFLRFIEELAGSRLANEPLEHSLIDKRFFDGACAERGAGASIARLHQVLRYFFKRSAKFLRSFSTFGAAV
jgi:hypothetical protein